MRQSDPAAARQRKKRADSDIETSKFNYARQQKERQQRWMQTTGVNKHLRQKEEVQAEQEGGSGSKAVAAGDDKAIQERKKRAGKRAQSEKGEGGEQEKRLREKYGQYLLNDAQLQVREQAAQLQGLVEAMDENNEALVRELEETQEYLEREGSKLAPGAVAQAGSRVEQELRELHDEIDALADHDVDHWGTELWRSLEEFEKMILEEQRGYELAYEHLHRRYRGHVTQLKATHGIYIQALEAALTETKLAHKRDVERLSMTLADVESRALNSVQEPKRVTNELARYENGVVLHNVREARHLVSSFLRIIRSKDTELSALDKALTSREAAVETYNDRMVDREKWYLEERGVRQYYQQIVFKLTRDLKLFDEQPEKLEKFQQLYEKEDDLTYQKQVHFILEHIGLREALLAHVNRHFGLLEGLTKIKQNLGDIGVIEPDEPAAAESTEPAMDLENASPPRGLDRIEEEHTPSRNADAEPKESAASEQEDMLEGLRLGRRRSSERARKPAVARSPLRRRSSVQGSLMRTKTFDNMDMLGPAPMSQQNPMLEKLQQGIKDAVKQRLQALFAEAREGTLGEPAATEDTGHCPIPEEDFSRNAMNEWIQDLKPELLEDFRLAQAKEVTAEKLYGRSERGEHQERETTKRARGSRRRPPPRRPSCASGVSQARPAAPPSEDDRGGHTARQVGRRASTRPSGRALLDSEPRNSGKKRDEGTQKSKEAVATDERESQGLAEASCGGRSSNASPTSNDKDLTVPRKRTPSRSELRRLPRRNDQEGAGTEPRAGSDGVDDGRPSQRHVTTSLESESSFGVTSQQRERRASKQIEVAGLSSKSSKSKATLLDDQEGRASPRERERSEEANSKTPTKTGYEGGAAHEPVPEVDGNDQRTGDTKQAWRPFPPRAPLKIYSTIFQVELLPEANKPQISVISPKISAMSPPSEEKKPPIEVTATSHVRPAQNPEQQESLWKKLRDKKQALGALKKDQNKSSETPVTGIGIVYRELRLLHAQKYAPLIAEVEKARKSTGQGSKAYAMRPPDVAQLQVYALQVLGLQVSTDQLRGLQHSDVHEFFEAVNRHVGKAYRLEPHLQNTAHGGRGPQANKMSNANEKQNLQQKEQAEEHRSVPFGSLLQPVFSASGELKGVQFDCDLIAMMFKAHGSRLLVLKRAIKACVYINQLLSEGQATDYLMKKMETPDLTEKAKKKAHVQVQVDMLELQRNGEQAEQDDQSLGEGQQEHKLIDSIKNHLAKMMGQLRPERAIMYRETLQMMGLEELAEYELEDIYRCREDIGAGRWMTAAEYITNILSQVQLAASTIADDRLRVLCIEGLIKLGSSYQALPARTTAAVQAAPVMRPAATNTEAGLLTAYVAGGELVVRQGQHQLALDRAIEQEFEKTLQLFDQFADQLAQGSRTRRSGLLGSGEFQALLTDGDSSHPSAANVFDIETSLHSDTAASIGTRTNAARRRRVLSTTAGALQAQGQNTNHVGQGSRVGVTQMHSETQSSTRPGAMDADWRLEMVKELQAKLRASLQVMAFESLPKVHSKAKPRHPDNQAHNDCLGLHDEQEYPSNGQLLSDLLNSAENAEESSDPYGAPTPNFQEHSLMQGFGVDGQGLGAWRTVASPLIMQRIPKYIDQPSVSVSNASVQDRKQAEEAKAPTLLPDDAKQSRQARRLLSAEDVGQELAKQGPQFAAVVHQKMAKIRASNRKPVGKVDSGGGPNNGSSVVGPATNAIKSPAIDGRSWSKKSRRQVKAKAIGKTIANIVGPMSPRGIHAGMKTGCGLSAGTDESTRRGPHNTTQPDDASTHMRSGSRGQQEVEQTGYFHSSKSGVACSSREQTLRGASAGDQSRIMDFLVDGKRAQYVMTPPEPDSSIKLLMKKRQQAITVHQRNDEGPRDGKPQSNQLFTSQLTNRPVCLPMSPQSEAKRRVLLRDFVGHSVELSNLQTIGHVGGSGLGTRVPNYDGSQRDPRPGPASRQSSKVPVNILNSALARMPTGALGQQSEMMRRRLYAGTSLSTKHKGDSWLHQTVDNIHNDQGGVDAVDPPRVPAFATRAPAAVGMMLRKSWNHKPRLDQPTATALAARVLPTPMSCHPRDRRLPQEAATHPEPESQPRHSGGTAYHHDLALQSIQNKQQFEELRRIAHCSRQQPLETGAISKSSTATPAPVPHPLQSQLPLDGQHHATLNQGIIRSKITRHPKLPSQAAPGTGAHHQPRTDSLSSLTDLQLAVQDKLHAQNAEQKKQKMKVQNRIQGILGLNEQALAGEQGSVQEASRDPRKRVLILTQQMLVERAEVEEDESVAGAHGGAAVVERGAGRTTVEETAGDQTLGAESVSSNRRRRDAPRLDLLKGLKRIN